MPDNSTLEEGIETIIDATLTACAMLHAVTGESTARIATNVIAGILQNLVLAAKTDSVNIAAAVCDGQKFVAHIHFGYLDADPAHVLDPEAHRQP